MNRSASMVAASSLGVVVGIAGYQGLEIISGPPQATHEVSDLSQCITDLGSTVIKSQAFATEYQLCSGRYSQVVVSAPLKDGSRDITRRTVTPPELNKTEMPDAIKRDQAIVSANAYNHSAEIGLSVLLGLGAAALVYAGTKRLPSRKAKKVSSADSRL